MGPPARVVVVGLGPSLPDLIPSRAVEMLAAARRRFVRTRWHPAAEAVADAESFDVLYDSADSFEDVYSGIVETVVNAAIEEANTRSGDRGYVAYAVPGSPLVAETAVAMLMSDNRVVVEVVPAMSFLDLAWQRLSIDPVDAGLRIVDGERFALQAAGERGPLLVAQCWSKRILSEIKLAGDPDSYRAGRAVTVLQRLGCPDESVFTLDWDDLDREVEADHMTSIYIPAMGAPVAMELMRLDELVRTLRECCPWDRKQTHHSLTKHLIEEAYEVLDAISALPDSAGSVVANVDAAGVVPEAPDGDPAAEDPFEHLKEELGDLLFQVLFHARLAAEEGIFDLSEVARNTHDKLVGRHPHIFGDVVAETAEQVVANWEQIKKTEKGRTSIMDGIPVSLPSLAYAYKVQKKAASVGFDWPDERGPLAKITEEVAELSEALKIHGETSTEARKELGDVLFSLVNASRHLGIDPEVALRESVGVFRRRFASIEAAAAGNGNDLAEMSLEEMDCIWGEAKATETRRSGI